MSEPKSSGSDDLDYSSEPTSLWLMLITYTSIFLRLAIKTIRLSPEAAITRTFQISERFLGGDNGARRWNITYIYVKVGTMIYCHSETYLILLICEFTTHYQCSANLLVVKQTTLDDVKVMKHQTELEASARGLVA